MNCLEAFLNGDVLHAGYTVQIDIIKQVIEAKIKKLSVLIVLNVYVSLIVSH